MNGVQTNACTHRGSVRKVTSNSSISLQLGLLCADSMSVKGNKFPYKWRKRWMVLAEDKSGATLAYFDKQGQSWSDAHRTVSLQ